MWKAAIVCVSLLAVAFLCVQLFIPHCDCDPYLPAAGGKIRSAVGAALVLPITVQSYLDNIGVFSNLIRKPENGNTYISLNPGGKVEVVLSDFYSTINDDSPRCSIDDPKVIIYFDGDTTKPLLKAHTTSQWSDNITFTATTSFATRPVSGNEEATGSGYLVNSAEETTTSIRFEPTQSGCPATGQPWDCGRNCVVVFRAQK